ncbi:MAG: DUF2147 domain-containing protein [Flavobacteriaceae bacterium]|nr:MAG: DUF2147 domain-containing protein [Flavobacteriaceae bacterium]
MKKFISFVFAFFFAISMVSAQSLEGTWKTIDDVDGKPSSYVKIFKSKDGKYYGNVVKIMDPKEQDSKCDDCTDYRKNQKILGMQILKDLKQEGKTTKYSGGNILDPENGKVYKCFVVLNGDKLQVKGYIGIEALGRSQTWYRVK